MLRVNENKNNVHEHFEKRSTFNVHELWSIFEKKDDFQVHTNVDLCRSLNTSFGTESGTTLVMHNTLTTKFAQCRRPQFICMTPIVRTCLNQDKPHHMRTW